MTGNIQIEVLNESAVMVAAHLKEVSDFTYNQNLYPAIEIHYWTTPIQSATMNTLTGGTQT